eukprot:2960805-Rhodomonas_salina.1
MLHRTRQTRRPASPALGTPYAMSVPQNSYHTALRHWATIPDAMPVPGARAWPLAAPPLPPDALPTLC